MKKKWRYEHPCLSFLVVLTVYQNSPPRFFYVNNEIVKRRDAVTIGVRLQVLTFLI